ncbi:glycoside hydrolase, partial [Marimonas arenosa]|nr:glycoside hydrolase [Marimonas arenosa]
GGGDDTYDGRNGTLNGDVFGGTGNDIYITDDAALQIVELADQGTDEVRSTVRYILGDNLENLTLLG